LSDTAQAAQNPEKAEGGFMVKVAAAIVDRRNLIVFNYDYFDYFFRGVPLLG